MNLEDGHFAIDKGGISSEDKLFPYITDKNALIPPEYFNVTLHGFENSRSHTIYLDPAFSIKQLEPNFNEFRLKGPMYEASITLRAPYAYGEGGHQRASAKAREVIGNDRSPRYYEEYIRTIHDNDRGLRLIHILAAESRLGGSYLIFGWISPESEPNNLHAE
jgi:hypothetical protein